VNSFASYIWPTSFILSFMISLLTIKISIKILSKTKTLDIPNERSNHNAPIIKGAGIGIITTFMMLYYIYFPITDQIVTISLGLLCLLSFINDNRQISIIIRLLIQIICSFLVIKFWPPFLNLTILENILPSWVVLIIILIFFIWLINLFNFMDGIDGISGVQCIILGIGTGLCLFLSNETNKHEYIITSFLAGSGLAFLIWNWQPAKVFLGDAGSIPLGFLNAILVLLLFNNGLWYVALILNSYYFADSSITLLKRMLMKNKPWKAHKTHYYQIAVQNGSSHSKVCKLISIHGILLILLASFASVNDSLINIFLSVLISSISTIYLLYYLNKKPKNNMKAL
jgi:UDP-N-acetylmuramyl pentapeptide phosphotransferase/UDP-N-acetylglucosamine-1-phosphate transferase